MSAFGIWHSGLRISTVVALLLSTLSATANAIDRVWLIGGGYDLQNSQVQIEQNVLWARTVLQALPGERSIQTYFNDGDDPAPDVTLWQKPAETAATLQPLARVYDADYVNGEAIRSHAIATVDGPATRQTLLDELPQSIERLAPGEQGLLIYAGHGSPGEHGSLLDLWGDEQFDAGDLRTLIAAQPRDTTLRFVFTQCFAGGFHTALLPQAGAAATLRLLRRRAGSTRRGLYGQPGCGRVPWLRHVFLRCISRADAHRRCIVDRTRPQSGWSCRSL